MEGIAHDSIFVTMFRSTDYLSILYINLGFGFFHVLGHGYRNYRNFGTPSTAVIPSSVAVIDPVSDNSYL